jgi:hypothetical protein
MSIHDTQIDREFLKNLLNNSILKSFILNLFLFSINQAISIFVSLLKFLNSLFMTFLFSFMLSLSIVWVNSFSLICFVFCRCSCKYFNSSLFIWSSASPNFKWSSNMSKMFFRFIGILWYSLLTSSIMCSKVIRASGAGLPVSAANADASQADVQTSESILYILYLDI